MSLEIQQTAMATYDWLMEQTPAYWKDITLALLIVVIFVQLFSRPSRPTRPATKIVPWSKGVRPRVPPPVCAPLPSDDISKEKRAQNRIGDLEAENSRLRRLTQDDAQLRAEDSHRIAQKFEEERESDVKAFNREIAALDDEYEEKLRWQKEDYEKKLEIARQVESHLRSAGQTLQRERDDALGARAQAERNRDASQTTSQQSQLETKQTKKKIKVLKKQLETESEAEKAALKKHREELKAHKAKESSQVKELDARQERLNEAATRERQLQDEITRLRGENESNLAQQRRAHDVQVRDLEIQLGVLQQLYGIQELQRAAVWERLRQLSNILGYQADATDNSAALAYYQSEVEALISEAQYGAKARDMRREVLGLVVPAAGLFDLVEGLLGVGNTQAILPVQTPGPLPESLTPAGEKPAGPQKRLLEAALEVEGKATDPESETKTESVPEVPASTATTTAPAPRPTEPAPTPLTKPLSTVPAITAPASTPAPKPKPESTPTNNNEAATNSTQAGAGAAESPAVSAANAPSAGPSKARSNSQSRRLSAARPRHAPTRRVKTHGPKEARRRESLQREKAAKKDTVTPTEDASSTHESEDEEKPKLSNRAVQGLFDTGRGKKPAQTSPARPTAPTAAPKSETQTTTTSAWSGSKSVANAPTQLNTSLQRAENGQAKQIHVSSAQATAPAPAATTEDKDPHEGRLQAMFNKMTAGQTFPPKQTVDPQIEAAQNRVSTPATQSSPALQQTTASTQLADRESEDVAMSDMQQSAIDSVSQSNLQHAPNAAPPALSTDRAVASQSSRCLEGSIHATEPMERVQWQQNVVSQAAISDRGGPGDPPRGLRESIHAPPATDLPPQQMLSQQMPPQAPTSKARDGATAPNPLNSSMHAPRLETSLQSQQNSPQITGPVTANATDSTEAGQQPAPMPASQTSSRTEPQRTQSRQDPDHERQEEEEAWREADKAKNAQANPIASISVASSQVAPRSTDIFQFGPTTPTSNNLHGNSGISILASRRQTRQQGGGGRSQRTGGLRTGAQLPRLSNRLARRRDDLESTITEASRQSSGQAPFPAGQTRSVAGTPQRQKAPMPAAPVLPIIPAPAVSHQQGDHVTQRSGQAHADSPNGHDPAPVETERTDLPSMVDQDGTGTVSRPGVDSATESRQQEPVQTAYRASSVPALDKNRGGRTIDEQLLWKLAANVYRAPVSAFAPGPTAAPTPPPLPASLEGQQGPSDATQTTSLDDDYPSPESTPPPEPRSPVDSPRKDKHAAMDDVPSPKTSRSRGFSPLDRGEDKADDRDRPSGVPGGVSPLQPGSEDEDEDMEDDDNDDDGDGAPMNDLDRIAKQHDSGDDDDDMAGGNASGSSAPNNLDDNNDQSGGSLPTNGSGKDAGNNTNAEEAQDEDDMVGDDGEIDNFEDVEGCVKLDSPTSDDPVDLENVRVTPNRTNSGPADTMTASTTTSQQRKSSIPPIPENILALFKGQEEENQVVAEQAAEVVDAYLPQLCGHCQGIFGNHLPSCNTVQQKERQEEEAYDDNDGDVDVEEDEDEDDGAEYPPGYCSECQQILWNHAPKCSTLQHGGNDDEGEVYQDYQDHEAPTGVCRLCNGIYGQHNPGCRRHPNPELRQGASDSAIPPSSTKEDGRAEADCTFGLCGTKKDEEHRLACPVGEEELKARNKKMQTKTQIELGFDGDGPREKQSSANIEDMECREVGKESREQIMMASQPLLTSSDHQLSQTMAVVPDRSNPHQTVSKISREPARHLPTISRSPFPSDSPPATDGPSDGDYPWYMPDINDWSLEQLNQYLEANPPSKKRPAPPAFDENNLDPELRQ